MLVGYFPFRAKNRSELKECIKQGNVIFDEEHWSAKTDEAKDLITKLLVVDPKKRLGYEEILEHPWLKKVDTDIKSEGRQLERTKSKVIMEVVLL
eukprot:UN01671